MDLTRIIRAFVTAEAEGIKIKCRVIVPSISIVSNELLNFIVDTGSQSTRIGTRDATILGVRYETLKRNNVGAHGLEVEKTEDYTVSPADLVFHDKQNQEVKIPLPKGIVFHNFIDNILGRDCLMQHKFRYDGKEFVIEV